VDLGREVAERNEIPRIKIGDAEQAGISRRHLFGVEAFSRPG